MVEKPTHLDRPIKLWLFKNGEVTLNYNPASAEDIALPVFSTDTQEDAESLLCVHCKMDRETGLWYLPFTGEQKDIDRVTQLFAEFTELQRKGYTGSDLAEPFERYRHELGLF